MSLNAAVHRIGPRVGVNPDTLRGWCKQAEIDAGRRPGTTTSDAARIKELRQEVRELKRANEILLAASSFFARELDPRLPWYRVHRRPPGPVRGRADLPGADRARRADRPVTYYAAQTRPPSPRRYATRSCWSEIVRVHTSPTIGRGLYGARKVWHQLPATPR